jgi:hypothetical protein
MRIVLEPKPMELGLHREQYDALVAELRAEGKAVALVSPEETRSVPSVPGAQAFL